MPETNDSQTNTSQKLWAGIVTGLPGVLLAGGVAFFAFNWQSNTESAMLRQRVATLEARQEEGFANRAEMTRQVQALAITVGQNTVVIQSVLQEQRDLRQRLEPRGN